MVKSKNKIERTQAILEIAREKGIHEYCFLDRILNIRMTWDPEDIFTIDSSIDYDMITERMDEIRCKHGKKKRIKRLFNKLFKKSQNENKMSIL